MAKEFRIKEGDFCILWDDYEEDAICDIVEHIRYFQPKYETRGSYYKNAIPFISIDDFKIFKEQKL